MVLVKVVDVMVYSIWSFLFIDVKKEKYQEYENECWEKYVVFEVKLKVVEKDMVKDKEEVEVVVERESFEVGVVIRDGSYNFEVVEDDKFVEDVVLFSYQRKINVFYEFFFVCLLDKY